MTALWFDPETVPTLLTGNRITWPTQVASNGEPKAWSCAHRVFQNGFTYCSRPIPSSAVIVERSGKPSVGKCSRCERMANRAAQYRRDRMADAAPGSIRND